MLCSAMLCHAVNNHAVPHGAMLHHNATYCIQSEQIFVLHRPLFGDVTVVDPEGEIKGCIRTSIQQFLPVKNIANQE